MKVLVVIAGLISVSMSLPTGIGGGGFGKCFESDYAIKLLKIFSLK
jgi:hypothetical protein